MAAARPRGRRERARRLSRARHRLAEAGGDAANPRWRLARDFGAAFPVDRLRAVHPADLGAAASAHSRCVALLQRRAEGSADGPYGGNLAHCTRARPQVHGPCGLWTRRRADPALFPARRSGRAGGDHQVDHARAEALMARSRRSRSRRSSSAPKARISPLAIVRATLDAIVVGFFLLILLVSPLPMGANRDWAWAPITVVIGIVAVLVALGLGSRDVPATAPQERLPLGALIVCFLLMLGIGLLQMSPLAPAGPSAPFYARAAAVLGRAHAAVPTLSIDTSLGTLLRCLACGLVFAVARIFCTDERRARLLLLTLIASAILVMIYAVLGLQTHSCFVGNYLKKQGEYMQTDRCTMSGT